jgi:hypothetical protein
VQTFLPYADFAESARALDDRRLGKQRVEAMQIIRALTWPKYGWRHHPAVKMWRGHLEALGRYALVITEEWTARGHADSCAEKILIDLKEAGLDESPRSQAELADAGALPKWLGDPDFHASHRSSLLRKDPVFYGARFDEPDDLPYVWPPEALEEPVLDVVDATE